MLVSLVLPLPAFVLPSRIWFGQISDAKPMWDYHSTAYVWVRAAIFAIALLINSKMLI